MLWVWVRSGLGWIFDRRGRGGNPRRTPTKSEGTRESLCPVSVCGLGASWRARQRLRLRFFLRRGSSRRGFLGRDRGPPACLGTGRLCPVPEGGGPTIGLRL